MSSLINGSNGFKELSTLNSNRTHLINRLHGLTVQGSNLFRFNLNPQISCRVHVHVGLTGDIKIGIPSGISHQDAPLSQEIWNFAKVNNTNITEQYIVFLLETKLFHKLLYPCQLFSSFSCCDELCLGEKLQHTFVTSIVMPQLRLQG